jgi:hypothetical protein
MCGGPEIIKTGCVCVYGEKEWRPEGRQYVVI